MINVNDLLSDFDLNFYGQLLGIKIHAILQKDKFNSIKKLKQGAYIINLQSSTRGNGSHWTSLIIYSQFAVYFDSYGLSIPQPLLSAILRTNSKMKIIYSTDTIQSNTSIFCGWFCLFFLYFFLKMHPNCKNYETLLNLHNSIYSLTKKNKNDKILQSNIKNIFRQK